MRFNFANLVGGRSKPKASEDAERDEEALDETEDEEEQVSSEENSSASDENAETENGGEENETSAEEKAAYRRGLAAGRKAERARCGEIIASAEPHTVAMAANLAFNTSLTPAEAKAALAAAPEAPKADAGLAARMKGRDPAPAAQADAERSQEEKTAERILANAGRGRRSRDG